MGRLCLIAGCVASFLVSSAPGHAQEQPPYDPAIDVQLFEYAIGPKSFFTVSDADITARKGYTVDFLLTFLTDPFTVYNVDPAGGDEIVGERTQVVRLVLAGQLSGAYGLTDRLQLGVALPLVFSMSGDGLDPATAMPSADGLQASGLGDLRAELESQIWKSGRVRLAAAGGLTLPTSFGAGGSDFLGDDLPSLRGRLALQWTSASERLTAGTNVGVILRKPRMIYASEVGQQLVYGAGAAFHFTGAVAAIGEVFGRTGLTSFDLEASPLEVNGGVRVRATEEVSVLAGGGAGVVRGIGSPDVRAFVSVGWAPDYRDTDGDGIVNRRDRCPLSPEDPDGFEDDDGCPDDDNDGDLREDAIDKCPGEKEDIDGYEDDDGCPEIDNDGDGIADLDDRCPVDAEDGKGAFTTDGCPANKTDSDDDQITDDVDRCPEELEDFDGFEDWDGCPEVDNDRDGVNDEDDRCPLCSEDRDNYEDEDGCPEIDNDGDGLGDDIDQCPLEAEVVNGVKDDDGCPDRGGKVMARLEGDLLILDEKLRFAGDGRLRRRSRPVVDQVATIMRAHPEVTGWLLVVGDRSRDRGQRNAEGLAAELVARGLAEGSIQATGAEGRALVAIKVVARAEPAEDGAIVCPARFRVEPAPAPVAPASPAAAEPAASAPAASEPAASEPAASEPAASEPATSEPAASTPAAPASEPAAPATPRAAAPATAVPPAFAAYSGVVAVEFRRNSDRMRSRAKKTLAAVAELLAAHPQVRLDIATHTDSRKGPERSLAITQSQADAIVKFLVDKGISVDRLRGVGHGMDRPIADNARSSGRRDNRRVEFTFSVEP